MAFSFVEPLLFSHRLDDAPCLLNDIVVDAGYFVGAQIILAFGSHFYILYDNMIKRKKYVKIYKLNILHIKFMNYKKDIENNIPIE